MRLVEASRPRGLPVAIVLGIAAVLALGVAGPSHALDVAGFVKNFFFVQSIPRYETAPGDPSVGGQTVIADNLRMRVNVSAGLTDWMEAFVAYNFIPRIQDDDLASLNAVVASEGNRLYRVNDVEPYLYPADPGSDDNFVILQNLDRLYLSFAAPAFDFYLGRQAVAWGSARSVNPTDVIAPFLYTEFDTENRIGVDAVRLRVPTGALGEVDAGYIAGKDFEDRYSAWYGRSRVYLWNTDTSLMLMRFRTNWLVGVDFTRAIAGAGFWFEGAWVSLSDSSRARQPDLIRGTAYDLSAYTRISTGLDYSLGDGTYLYLEYHYNGAGGNDAGDYRYLGSTSAYIDGALYLFGRHYVIPGVSWPVTPLWSVSGSVLWNLSDGSALFAPVVEYNVAENVYASVTAFVGIGPAPTWDPVVPNAPVVGNGIILDPANTAFASEFGAYPDTYFLEIRYYY